MTIDFDPTQKLFVEKYRPNKVADCILQERTKKEVLNIVKDGHIPNLLFYGPAGCGKTTLARALCRETGVDWILINASNERGLDTIREKVATFASTASLDGNTSKCVILDEADRLTPVAMDALKAEIERYSKSCSFIMTANHPNRLIEPLRSRLVGIDFQPKKDEFEVMQAEFFMRACQILDNEGITYDEMVLIQVIQRFFPDNRRVLGELQQYARGSKDINEGILMQIEGASTSAMIKAVVDKKFKDVVQWAADNANNDTTTLYEEVYKQLKEFVVPTSIADAIMILEDYQRYDSIVPSKELHLSAMATELMTTLEFKV